MFKLVLTGGAYKHYTESFMTPEQIDDVDISKFLREEERYI
ncbi:hypothetical protein [Methylophaga nitratireducenticrescens]|uniref:Uncharacterized protein n=1 Tax=Methylophaga nitratireducenticrescens TaxID=754476 RepID=I1XGT5_METNJ|nr:hypothetical protein [Methylophaga nitratireducenticrescens]